MTSGRNFLAGLASSGWTALAGLLAVPWYIHYLGIEAYGVIGVYLTLQAVFALLDLGLPPAISREVARSIVNGTMPYARTLVHSMSWLFALSGGAVAVALIVASPWLAQHWLNAGSIPVQQVAMALALSAVAIAARWPATLYIGVLNGARRVDLASAVLAGTTTLATIGAIAVLALIEPTLRAFFIWQAFVGALHSVAMRAAAHHAIGTEMRAVFSWAAIRKVWRFSAGMAAVAATGILFAQIDKIVLMRTASLDQVGHYAIATTLASLLYRLVMPAFNVVYPQFSGLIEAQHTAELSQQYHRNTRFFLTVLFPVAMMLIVCAHPILQMWINDNDVVAQTTVLVMLLSFGTAVHCIMYFPYALQIAHGLTALPLTINIVLSGIFLPAVVLLSIAMGATGAALAWLILHLCYLALGTWLTHRRLLPGEGWRWVSGGVLPPLAISLAFGLVAMAIMPFATSDILRLLVGATCALAAFAAGALTLPEARTLLRRTTGQVTRGLQSGG